jgi:hypothetical protein
MITITTRTDGTYAIDGDGGPQFLVVHLSWLNALVRELRDRGMLEMNGIRLVRPPE